MNQIRPPPPDPPAAKASCCACPAHSACVFSGIPEEALTRWHAISQLRGHGPGAPIFRQGERSHGLFVVRSGLLRLVRLEPSGKRVLVGLTNSSQVLGLTEVITGAAYHVSAEPMQVCELEYVPRGDFMRFLLDWPAVAVDLLIHLSEELETVLATLSQTTAGSAPPARRILRTLHQVGCACGEVTSEGIELRVPLTVQDLADHVGLSRQWTSQLLQKMMSEGLVRRTARTLVVTRHGLVEVSRDDTPESDQT
jgi:CRP-like cAMP-binding protein